MIVFLRERGSVTVRYLRHAARFINDRCTRLFRLHMNQAAMLRADDVRDERGMQDAEEVTRRNEHGTERPPCAEVQWSSKHRQGAQNWPRVAGNSAGGEDHCSQTYCNRVVVVAGSTFACQGRGRNRKLSISAIHSRKPLRFANRGRCLSLSLRPKV